MKMENTRIQKFSINMDYIRKCLEWVMSTKVKCCFQGYLLEINAHLQQFTGKKDLCKWIYERLYILIVEKDMKTWLIIAVIHSYYT